MIIDGFMFNNELDILEMRLEELYPVVDRFVLVQSWQNFRGNPKELSFHKGEKRWEQYADKIDQVNIGMTGVEGDAWAKEQFQRNVIGEIAKVWSKAPDDILIISDVDEIPKRHVIESASMFHHGLDDGPCGISMKMYYYSLNVRKGEGEWDACRILKMRDLTTAQEIRHSEPLISLAYEGRGGWHYSYLGDDQFISDKLKAFSHSELDTPEVHAKIADNRAALLDPYNHGEQLHIEEFDWAKAPHAVRNNPEYWRKYIA